MKDSVIKTSVILAGGYGTRLGKEFQNTPKSIIKIDKYPLIISQIKLLKKYKIKLIYIVLGYQSEKIKKTINKYKNIKDNVRYIYDDKLIGTSYAISLAISKIKKNFFLLYGDIFLDINFKNISNFHYLKKSKLTVVTQYNENPLDSDHVTLHKENQIKKIIPRNKIKNIKKKSLSTAALFVIDPKTIKIKLLVNKKDFVADYLDYIIRYQCYDVFSYFTNEFLRDIGTKRRINKTIKDYTKYKNDNY